MTLEAGRCPTCGDTAIAARVEAVDGAEAAISFRGETERVALDLVPDAQPGDLLLCHAGIALERIDEGGVA